MGCYVCSPRFGCQGKVSDPTICILFCVSHFCRIHIPQSQGSLPAGFSDKEKKCCVFEAAFLVCPSTCLQLQLSLSEEVLYQMVSSNYFPLSPLNCPILRPGNKTSILLLLFLSGSMRRQNVKYSAGATWVCIWMTCGLFLFCSFMVWFCSLFQVIFPDADCFWLRKEEVGMEGSID